MKYLVEPFRLKFRVKPDCPIGRHESTIAITVADSGNRLGSTAYIVPVFIRNMRGLSVEPCAVTLGYNIVEETTFPLTRQVKISGSNGVTVSDLRVEPEGTPVSARIRNDSTGKVVVDIVVEENVATDRPLEVRVWARVADGRGNSYQLALPVSGVFVTAGSL